MSRKQRGGVSCQRVGGGEEYSDETDPSASPAGYGSVTSEVMVAVIFCFFFYKTRINSRSVKADVILWKKKLLCEDESGGNTAASPDLQMILGSVFGGLSASQPARLRGQKDSSEKYFGSLKYLLFCLQSYIPLS